MASLPIIDVFDENIPVTKKKDNRSFSTQIFFCNSKILKFENLQGPAKKSDFGYPRRDLALTVLFILSFTQNNQLKLVFLFLL